MQILDVQTKSKIFGRVLKLPASTVDRIHVQYSDPEECLFQVMDEFVKQVEPRPTWRAIVNALRNPLIGFTNLVEEIEYKLYGKTSTLASFSQGYNYWMH